MYLVDKQHISRLKICKQSGKIARLFYSGAGSYAYIYVDAELSSFDISKDLSLKVEPTTFNDGKSKDFNSVGLQCSLNF